VDVVSSGHVATPHGRPEGHPGGGIMSLQGTLPDTGAKVSLFNDPAVRGIAYQVVVALVIVFLFYEATTNAVENLRAAKIASGFGFMENTAGFDINQTLIHFSSTDGSTYGRAFYVGLLNTLLVSSIAIVFSTVLGFVIGIARLSPNWIVRKLSAIYVEVIRNIPLLLQLLFWYNAVLKPLPDPRNSITIPGGIYINNRGLIVPEPLAGSLFSYVYIALGLAIVMAYVFWRYAKKVQIDTGRILPKGLVAVGLIFGLPLLAFALAGFPLTFDLPKQSRFNLTGGMQVYPEFVALLLGLSIYTAAFIAENVRAGILAVSKGQSEAAAALGLSPGQILRLVVVPQAMRVIIPPLTSQYLNVTKNSSLAVAIGYPDLVQVFAGTVLNQTGQAIECIGITMAVYLTISLVTSYLMNLYNSRNALVER
jgi:general L-amino acid transport system permease protein